MELPIFRNNYRLRLVIAALFLMLAFGFCATGIQAANSQSTDASAKASQNALGQALSAQGQNELISMIKSGELADLRSPNFVEDRAQVLTFYEAGDYSLAWVRDNEPTPQASILIQLFKAAAENGLNPDDYDAS